jgi:general secretion pathway protein B
MSLILEALRKSEERRRLGETPSLISESAWATRRRYHARASRRGVHLIVVALVLSALAAAAWWWWKTSTPMTSTPPTPASTPTAIPSTAATTPAATPRAIEHEPMPDADSAASPVTRRAPAEPIPSTPPAAVQATPLPTTPEDLDPGRAAIDPAVKARFERGEVFANSVDQLRTVQPTSETPYVPADAALPQPLPDPENPPELAALPPPATAPVPAPAVAAAQPTIVAEAQADSDLPSASNPDEVLPLHWQLSVETRTRLPALKLSMHVYADDPAGRFVILDGKRRVEGDPIDQGLRLEAIRRDGVVLSYNGQRFLVARAGQ